MNVALLTHNVIKGDGQGRVVYELARYLLKTGGKVSLVADVVDEELLDFGVTWIKVHPQNRRINLLKVREFAHRADQVLKENVARFDVVHGHGYVSTKRNHVNTVHFVHGAWLRSPARALSHSKGIRKYYHPLYSKWNARWEKHAFAQSDCVVAVSEMVQRELIAIGVSPNKTKVVQNGVDLDTFAPGENSRLLLNLPLKTRVALFVGDLHTPRKNLDTVLEAIARVSGVHLAVIGNFEGTPFPAMAVRLGIAERIHFLGTRSDVADIMRECDFFVCPSRYDPCPLVVLEALASGLPVITARTVGASDLITLDCGVVLNDPNDVLGLTKAIQSFCENKNLETTMGRNARAIAQEHTWIKMAQSYCDLYLKIMRCESTSL